MADGAILLIEDAVISAAEGGGAKELLESLMVQGVKVYALEPDLQARGIRKERLVQGVGTVDYDGFVGLVEKYDVVPWL